MITLSRVIITVLVLVGMVGFWWPPALFAFGIVGVWFLADKSISVQCANENDRIRFRSGVDSSGERFDNERELYDHDRQ